MKTNFKNIDIHWADFSAQKTIDNFPNEEIYNVASGITPSGFIHIGNFREVITTELVRRALEKKGKKTKFYFSFDSYDRFRKIPKELKNKNFEKYIGEAVGFIPNPFEEEENCKSYGDFFIKTFIEDVKNFGLKNIEFQKQHLIQTSGIYSNDIKKILQNKNKIIDILNKFRNEETQLTYDWWPIDIYDDETKKDTNKIISYDGNFTLTYTNENKIEKTINFKESPRVKLRWKCDWPMRWNFFKISFEPGGKDHSTPGSSYSVGCEIIKEIFGREPPQYTMYDFVKIKGQGSKISSSKGGALRIKELNEIYTSELILFIFASSRPNKEINLSFDLDVIKIYEDFDKLERLYYGLETQKNEKELIKQKRIYELLQINNTKPQKEIPTQFSFRHLTTIVQTNNNNFEKVKNYYKPQNEFDENRLKQRFDCAKNWLEKYAPTEMIFSIVKKINKKDLEENQIRILNSIKEKLIEVETGKELMLFFKEICLSENLEIKDFFSFMYKTFLNSEKGPKLGSLMIENKEIFLELMTLN
jgi:lysyl-tRNA synthetase class 1